MTKPEISTATPEQLQARLAEIEPEARKLNIEAHRECVLIRERLDKITAEQKREAQTSAFLEADKKRRDRARELQIIAKQSGWSF